MKILKWLSILVAGFFAFGTILLGYMVWGERGMHQSAKALRSQIQIGMSWADVAAKLESDPHWWQISFEGAASCGSIFGGSYTKNIPGQYKLYAEGPGTPIKSLHDPSVVAQLKSCPTLRVSFHAPAGFSKTDFSMQFDPSGKVASTTKPSSSD